MNRQLGILVCVAAPLFFGCGDDRSGPSDLTQPDSGRTAPDIGLSDADADAYEQVLPCDDVMCDCMIGPEGGSCATSYCVLSVDAGTLSRERFFSLSERVVAGPTGEELLGRRACALETTARPDDLSGPYELSIHYDEGHVPADFDESEVVGAVVDPEPTWARNAVLDVDRNRVSLGMLQPTTLAASVMPADPRVERELGLDTGDVMDPVELVRNLSRHTFGAVFHDGQRLYVGNGPRVLIWNAGVPDLATRPPDVVLGRPDLLTNSPFTSASSFKSSASAIWSDGTRLAVAEGHRVLIWNRVPTQNFVPADLVLGQDDFTTNLANKDGLVGPDTLHTPSAIASDGRRFAVADTLNHRVLVWRTFPSVTSQPADEVIGQEDMWSARIGGGAIGLYQPWGAYLDATRFAVTSAFGCNCINVIDGFPGTSNPAADYQVGRPTYAIRVSEVDFLAAASLSAFGTGGLAFHNGHRVSVWRSFPEVSGPADFTVGKPDPTLGLQFGRISAASLTAQAPGAGMFATDRELFVADGRRLLVWRTLPDASFAAADMVIGQPSMATAQADVDYRGISERTLAQPTSVSSAGDVTVVADRANNRVLVLRGPPTQPTSVVVLGQRSEVEFLAQTTSASSLRVPAGVFTDGSRVVVADSGNHRVLVWNSVPRAHGAPADLVLGQMAFDGGLQNGGLPDADADGDIDADATTLHFPSGVWASGDRILAADSLNNRIVAWDTPVTNGAAATVILGQPDEHANDPNRGAGWWTRGADTLARPSDVAVLDDGSIAVADTENNRVMLFAPGDTDATVVLGQPDFVSDVSPNWQSGVNTGWAVADAAKSAGATTLRWPYALDAAGSQLLVADAGNHRIVRYQGPLATEMPADEVFGQADFESRRANFGGVGASGLDGPEGAAFGDSGILVADTDNHRLLEYGGTDGLATAVFGQTTLLRNGINGSSPAWDRLERPAGMHVDGGVVWIADRGHHRVVGFASDKLSRVLGQVDRGGAQRNAGQRAAAGWTMSQPSDVWTDGTVMIVADRDNHRVMIWNEIPDDPTTPADVFIGQSGPLDAEPNGGLGATAAAGDSLFSPEGVTVADGKLWIADTGNNRVLVFDRIPSSSGATADAVICQPDMASNLANRGAAEPSASSCAGPTDVLVVDGRVWVADSLNHRVLGFDQSADAADLVLGQADFETRRPLTTDNEVTAAIFHDPARLAWDGMGLFVVDRGNHRVLVFDEVPTGSSVAADRVFGQVGPDTAVVTPRRDGLHSPSGIFVIPGTYHRTAVWVTDAGKDRGVLFARVARSF